MSLMHHARRRKEQKKHRKSATLNLVSLMDIFTILVFFLMVNSSEVEVLQTSSKIKLPDSSSEQKPENQIVISVSADDLVVQGRMVTEISALSEEAVGENAIILPLREELEYQAARKGEVPEAGFEVTIMGDRELPYWLLKQIMLTCQTTSFAQISLAVNKMEAPATDGLPALPPEAVVDELAGAAS